MLVMKMLNLIKLALQHVNVIIRYHDQTRIRAVTLTSLQKSVPLPKHIILKHDIDEKVQQLKEVALKSGKHRDLVCGCELCLKLRENS